ncbi:hypothetical protein MKX08_002528 [Trichoderma sp. CBMAI-0020]|nr:hypothetical protein MKX08_002528 [Trichoderma sp. CBMAI-0020]
MELLEDSMSWISAVLMLIATVTLPLLIQYFRNADIAKTNVQTSKAQVPAPGATANSVTYRLRGVPSKVERHDVKELVKKVLALEDDITVNINSLADDPSRHGEKVATLDFSKTPVSLSKPTDNAEWKFLTYDHESNDYGKITLLFDTHFRGLTPLHSSSDVDCTIDLIAVSGLGSHAFGSFKERKGSHMWLRDSLAHDITNMRILIYGYDTQMDGSTSFANLDDLANEFQERIKSIRSYPRFKRSETSTTNPERPLILIGHSLGGIIIKADVIKEAFTGLTYIEHDKERQECHASLYFDNSRYGKVSQEHEGSLDWIWTHDKYQEWSKPNSSRFLYLQGKPGSGKSTLTRYFRENLLERDPDAKSAIVAKFFYSDRDGKLQRSHYNMLRCILYEVLGQHEALFYRYFQSEYRHRKALQERDYSGPVEWDYDSLKRIFSSMSDFSPAKRLYLIIDAVDESDDNDRREILNMMFNLCSKPKDCVIKIFLASRPIGVLQKNHSGDFLESKFLSIKLQDHTKSDIARFADSFLKDLEFSSFLKQATEYIVENAQGVFLWVQLVKKELLVYDEAGRCAEKDIFEFLKSLPTELEEMYQRMLSKMGRNRADIRDGIRMFQLVLFAFRPLAANELLHALAIPGELDAEFEISNENFQNNIPPERRITHCGGNFLEIRRGFGSTTYEAAGRDSVQVMHQTVREFFLRPDGLVATSDFKMSERDAHISISITCIRYVILCASTMAERFPDIKSWTSQNVKDCAQYLEKMTFATYALRHLGHHIGGCQEEAYVLDITSKIVDELMNNPTAYLLVYWVKMRLRGLLFKREWNGADTHPANRILYAAAKGGYPIAAEVSLLVGGDANVQDERLITPLHYAAENGYDGVVRLLLDNSANPWQMDNSGWTSLALAATRGHEAVVRLLLERGADSEPKEHKYGQTPLSLAAANGHEGVVRVLLESGANSESKDKLGQSPLSWAAENGHEAVVKVLLDNRVDIESIDYEYGGRTPLSWAAANGHEAVVRLLLDKGADLTSKDDFGQSPLQHAAENGYEDVVRLLLENGADVEAKEYELGGRTPLSWAAENGHEAVVRLLLSKGAGVEFKESENGVKTPLAWAEENGHEAVVKLLLENDTDLYFEEDEYDDSVPPWYM